MSAGAVLDVAIVGGGPSGLATAIECQRAGLSYEVIEKGGLVDSIRRFPVNMIFFTTPELLEIGGLPLVCHREKPSRYEALVYYRKVAQHYGLRPRLFTRGRAVGARRESGWEPLRAPPEERAGGDPRSGPIRARNVVLAVGYYENPNRLDVPGRNSTRSPAATWRRHPYFGSKVAVIGGGNSAAEAALELFRRGGRHAHPPGRDALLAPEVLGPAGYREPSRAARDHRLAGRGSHGDPDGLPDPAGPRGQDPRDPERLRADAPRLPAALPVPRIAGRPQRGRRRPAGHRSGDLRHRGARPLPRRRVVAGRRTNMVFIENGRFHGEAIVRHICATR